MASVKFDNVELVSSSHAPKYIKHESAPDRDLSIVELAREGGSILVAEKYGEKHIFIAGTLKAASQSALETAIDNFKELFSRPEKNLDISWAGGTRRYVATCVKHTFNRDYLHLTFVPWMAEFVVPSGVGQDITLTAALDGVNVNANPYSSSVSFGGSAEPKPIITIEIGSGHTNPQGISFENTDTGEKISFTKSSALADGDTIVIDCAEKKVTLEGDEKSFCGPFPSFKVGDNNFKISVGEFLDQEFTGGSQWETHEIYKFSGNYYRIAECFTVPCSAHGYRRIGVWIRKEGTPNADLKVRIETDDEGAPSGTLVNDNAELTIAQGDVSTTNSWVYANFPGGFSLEAGVKYWIVLESEASEIDNWYIWPIAQKDATYKRGHAAYQLAGGEWTMRGDARFKLYCGGLKDDSLGNITLDIDYYKRYL